MPGMSYRDLAQDDQITSRKWLQQIGFAEVVPWFVSNLWYNAILSDDKQIFFLVGLHCF